MPTPLRRPLIALAGTALAAGVLLTGGSTHAGAVAPCDPLWTDPAGDQGTGTLSGHPDQMDLLSGTAWMNGSSLVVRMHVTDMNATPPAPYTFQEWFGVLNLNGHDLGVVADSDTAGLTGFDAYVDGNQGVAVSGSIVPGADGYAEIDVPLALVGSPAAGAPLTFGSAVSLTDVVGLDATAVNPNLQGGGTITIWDYADNGATTTLADGSGC